MSYFAAFYYYSPLQFHLYLRVSNQFLVTKTTTKFRCFYNLVLSTIPHQHPLAIRGSWDKPWPLELAYCKQGVISHRSKRCRAPCMRQNAWQLLLQSSALDAAQNAPLLQPKTLLQHWIDEQFLFCSRGLTRQLLPGPRSSPSRFPLSLRAPQISFKEGGKMAVSQVSATLHIRQWRTALGLWTIRLLQYSTSFSFLFFVLGSWPFYGMSGGSWTSIFNVILWRISLIILWFFFQKIICHIFPFLKSPKVEKILTNRHVSIDCSST